MCTDKIFNVSKSGANYGERELSIEFSLHFRGILILMYIFTLPYLTR